MYVIYNYFFSSQVLGKTIVNIIAGIIPAAKDMYVSGAVNN